MGSDDEAMTIYQRIDDPPAKVVESFETVDGLHVERVGCSRGRFIFTDWSPMIVVLENTRHATIKDCFLEGPRCRCNENRASSAFLLLLGSL